MPTRIVFNFDTSLSRHAGIALAELGHRVEFGDPGEALALVVSGRRLLVELAAESVTVREGDAVWAARSFPAGSRYRHEIRGATTKALVDAVSAITNGCEPSDAPPRPREPLPGPIDWSRHTSATIIHRVRAGVLDGGFQLFGAHREYRLRGAPGHVIAQRHGAICRATVDGAVWISHLKRPGELTLPATRALELSGTRVSAPEAGDGFREITYEESAGVGYLHFDVHGGVLRTDHCRRLLAAYREACARPTRVLVLMGGLDFFCAGLDHDVIEAADDPAIEAWGNRRAFGEVVRAVIETEDRIVVAALVGDVAGDGVPLALVADHVSARTDILVRPGGGEPLGARQALALGLVDDVGPADADAFRAHVRRLASDPGFAPRRRRHGRTDAPSSLDRVAGGGYPFTYAQA